MIVLLQVSLAMFAGLMMTRLLKKLKLNLPDVTAYLLAGLVVGPYCLGALKVPGLGFGAYEDVENIGVISNAALGFIAFAIGNEFRLSRLKETGRQATVIGILQALVAAILVDAALIALHFAMPDKLSLPVAITLGAIATATAPAATLMVVKQYKAKGKLTDILLPVVALDDAVGLGVFAVSFGIARALKSGGVDLISIVVNPCIEITLSLVLGAVLGYILTKLETLFRSNSNRLNLIITFVLLTVALSMVKIEIGPVVLSCSTLLVCMMLGTVFCNLCPLSMDLMDRSDKWTTPLFMLFFVLSGAELELSVFSDPAVVGIGVLFILTRSAGKYYGAYSSAKLVGCEKNVQRYLGITLLPQAGVALGMCMTASSLGGTDSSMIRNIVLFAVLVYEIVGPMLTKWALTKSGDIRPMSQEVANRREDTLNRMLEQKQQP